ncbi:unnamed protein product, partial [Prorocentrum cordatum]
ASRSLGYPAIVTWMEVTMHASPRMLKKGRNLSLAFQAGKSVVAGSPRGVDMAKVLPHGILQKAHDVSPTTGPWTFIDDTVCRNEGVEMTVVGDMQFAARSLATSFQQKDKTGRELSRRREGADPLAHRVKRTCSAVDLGVDVAGAKGRSQKKSRTRRERAKLRPNRIHKLRRLHGSHKVAQDLWRTGSYPAATFGRQVTGVPPTAVLSLRRQAAVAIVGHKRGRCLQTALQATLGVDDPGAPAQLCRLLLPKRVGKRSRLLLGGVTALLARSIGLFPTVGDDASKGAVLGDFDELLAAFSADVARLGWRKAAAHPRGETLTGGADLQLAQAELNSFVKKGSMDLWGATLAVLSGGQWPQDCKLEARY